MRFRNAFFASLGICGAALFFACGDASFGSSSNDDGGADATTVTDDASDDGNTGSSDGSAGGDAIGAQGDAGRPACGSTPITVLKVKMVACPATADPDQQCPVESGGTCCFDDAVGECNGSGVCSTPPFLRKWQCAKASDCIDSPCCLSTDAGDPTSCPAAANLVSAACAVTCGNDSRTMCESNSDCTGSAFTNCRPLFVRFFPDNLDAGQLVGVCAP